jgi:hypothetical protein
LGVGFGVGVGVGFGVGFGVGVVVGFVVGREAVLVGVAAVGATVVVAAGVVTGALAWAEVVVAGVLGPLAESVPTGPHPASVTAAAARTEAARSHLTGAECVLPIAVPFQRRDRRLP